MGLVYRWSISFSTASCSVVVGLLHGVLMDDTLLVEGRGGSGGVTVTSDECIQRAPRRRLAMGRDYTVLSLLPSPASDYPLECTARMVFRQQPRGIIDM